MPARTKRLGIRRPRRLDPSGIFAESDVAKEFIGRIHELVGPKLTYWPVAQIGRGHNAWRIDGPLGRGLLIQSDDGAQPGGTLRTRSVFIGNRWGVFPQAVGTLAAHEWNPRLAADQGEPIPKMSDRRRYRLRDERTAIVAARLDSATWWHWTPTGRVPGDGIPLEVLRELMNRFVHASPPPHRIERDEGYLKAYFSCRDCEWWGRGLGLVELVASHGERQLACPACETVLSIPSDRPYHPGRLPL